MNYIKTTPALIGSFLFVFFFAFNVRATDCPTEEDTEIVMIPGSQATEYIFSVSIEQEYFFAQMHITYLDANYPSKNREYFKESPGNMGHFEQLVNFDLNGSYYVTALFFTAECFLALEDIIEITDAEHSIDCSGNMQVELVDEDMGIYEAQWPNVLFDLNIPEPYHHAAEHEIYEYGDSIVMIRQPNSNAQVKQLLPPGYWDYFSEETGNKIFRQMSPWVYISPRQHLYMNPGEYTVKGRRAYSFEDSEGNLFQCEVTGKVPVEVSNVPVRPDCNSRQQALTLETHVEWGNLEPAPGRRFFNIDYMGAPVDDDLMEHDAYAFWLEAHEVQWDFGDGESILLKRTFSLFNYWDSKFSFKSHKYTQNGSYPVSFKVIAMSGCILMEAGGIVEITEFEEGEEEFSCEDLEASILHVDQPYSQEYGFTFTDNLYELDSSYWGPDNVVWRFEDGKEYDREAIHHLFRTNGEHTVELDVFYKDCKRTFQKVVQIDESFCSPYDFSALFNYWPEKDSIYLAARNTGSGYMYTWQVGNVDSIGLGLSNVVIPLNEESATVKVKMTIEDTNVHSPYYKMPLSDSVLLYLPPQGCEEVVQLTPSISSDQEGMVSFDIEAESGIDFYSITFGDGQSSYGTKICSGEDYHTDTREHAYVANGTYEVNLYMITSDHCVTTLKQELEITTFPGLEDEDTVTGVNGELLGTNLITTYPNPAKNELHISVKNMNQAAQWSIIDLTGTRVLSGRLSKADSSIDIKSLFAGLYILQVNIAGERYQSKIMVN